MPDSVRRSRGKGAWARIDSDALHHGDPTGAAVAV